MLLNAILFASTASSSVNSAYLWILIIVGLLTILGGTGGALALVKWLRKQGVRDSKLDQVITVVLGDPESNPPKLSRFDTIAFSIEEIKNQQSPNGLGTNELGDIAKRTELTTSRLEKSLTSMHSLLDQHIGKDEAVQEMLLQEVNKKQDKAGV